MWLLHKPGVLRALDIGSIWKPNLYEDQIELGSFATWVL